MTVFAFDRDWTVDVNPHPRKEAAPLEWVRHLAHETEHAVYAIGNQDLADEAAVPGVVDIVGMHPDDWDAWLGGKEPDGRYERFPTRRERLALIADLHPDEERVVVDDIDLSDVDGWEHYHAWEFVPAVERGEVDPSLPWVRDHATDGGTRECKGEAVSPTDGEHLDAWLAAHDAPGYELTYTADGGERSVVCRDLSLVERTLRRPAAALAFRCQPAPAGTDPFTVRAADIESVRVVDRSTAFPSATDAGPAERAAALRDRAADDPDAVGIPELLALLDDGDARPDALAALHHVADERPADCTPALPALRSLLTDESAAPDHALSVLAAVARADAAEVAPLLDVVEPYLSGGSPAVRRRAAACVSEVAGVDPSDAVDAVPGLATLAEDRVAVHHATHALSLVAAEHPAAVAPATPALGEVITDESLDAGPRLSATAAVGRVAGEQPGLAVALVDDVAELLGAEEPKLRNNAVGLLGDIATVHTDRVAPHADTVAGLFPTDDEFTRINGSAALARVAEDFPDRVAPHTDRLVALLRDDHPQVRANACWALGYLEAAGALAALEDLAVSDDEERVRKRAQWAVDRIEGAE